MIRSLRVKNFRSLEDVSLELGPLTVLVGPNGSGKSTILDAVVTLARLTRSPLYNRSGQEFFFGRPGWVGSGDFEHTVYGQRPEKDILFDVELEGERGEQGRYVLGVGRRDGRLLVVKEKMAWHSPGLDVEYDLTDRGPSDAVRLREQMGLTEAEGAWLPLPREVSLPFRVFPLRHQHAESPAVRAALAIQSALGPSHIHEFVPSRLATPTPHVDLLRSDGLGLVAVLDETLGRDRETFGRIENDLRRLFPEIEGLIVKPFHGKKGEKELFLRTVGPGGQIDVPAGMAPSGALVVIALLWILHTRPYALVGLDELEAHLHPWLLGKIMELTKKLSLRSQVILATHSPEVLNMLEDLEPVRICERDPQRGTYIVAPARNEESRRNLRDLFQQAVGAMWYSGHLGGVPADPNKASP